MRLQQATSPAQEALLPLAGLVYLGVPIGIFAFFWLKTGYHIVFFALASFWIYRQKTVLTAFCFFRPRQKHLLLFGLALLMALLAGSGNFLWQTGDHAKHEAVFFDLMQKNWPVRYGTDGSFLCYYLGYYLPPAFLSKYLFGKTLLPYLVLLWTATGLFLAMLLFARNAGKTSFWVLSLFFLQGGSDILLLSANALYSKYILSDLSIHAHFLQFVYFDNPFGDDLGLRYQAGLSLLYWVPQHWLSAAIAAGIFVEQGKRKSLRFVPAVFSFALFWSGFVAVGLLPLGLWTIKRAWPVKKPDISEWMLAFFCLILMAAFYAAHSPIDASGWFIGSGPEAAKYFLFIAVELGVAVFILWGAGRFTSYGGLAVFLLAGLLLIPLYRMGQYNDFCARASLPLLCALTSIMAASSKPFWAKSLLAVGFVFPLYLLGASIYLNLQGIQENHSGKSLETLDEFPGFMEQYLGKKDSFFEKHLLKPAQESPK